MPYQKTTVMVLLTLLATAVLGWQDVSGASGAEPAAGPRAPAVTPAVIKNVSEADGPSGRAATAPKKHSHAKDPSRKKFAHGFTAEREAAALTFVRQYHPELARLLRVLKTKEKEEYHRAIRDLFRTSERLAVYREKFPERYNLELEAWQNRSRIQLLATRLQLAPDDTKLAEQLKSALIEQIDIRVEILQQDREHQVERLKRLDEQIERLRKQREIDAERQLATLLRSVQKKPTPKQGPRQADKAGPKRGPQGMKPPDQQIRPTR